jgi:hypothetical protein
MTTVTPEDFQRLLLAHLRGAGWEVEEVGPLEIRIAAGGEQGAGVFNLMTMYQQFLGGALVGHIADALVQTLQESGGASPIISELEMDRLMPLLKPRAMLDEVKRTKVEPIAWRPFIIDDLIVTLVLDFPQSVRYVRQSEADATGREFDDLLEVALGNLVARTEGEVYELGDDQAGKMYILATQDGYDATRILLSPLLERLAGQVGGELVIGIPNRDFFIAFGNSNPLIVGQIGQQVKADAKSRPYALTDTLFTFRDGELKVYEQA